MSHDCQRVHQLFRGCTRHSFPFDPASLPANGVYVVFERGETGHGGDRIVRVGSHNGEGQLGPRLSQHFVKMQKDRSIFRKHVGRCLLTRNSDPYLDTWQLDTTSRAGKLEHGHRLDAAKQLDIEKQVSAIIQVNLTFAVLPVAEKTERLGLEARLIATLSHCDDCGPSGCWLGQYAPNEKIAKSGLWNIQHLWKDPLTGSDLARLDELQGQ